MRDLKKTERQRLALYYAGQCAVSAPYKWLDDRLPERAE
jgi:hypothetical protein